MSRTVSDFLAQPVSCFGPSIAGSICYFLSPTFKNHSAKEKSLRIAVYIFLCLSVPISMLLARKWGSMKHTSLRITVYCFVFVGTSLYSFYEDQVEQGRKDNGDGRLFDLFSYEAFSLAALSISRQIDFGFEVGMFSFFLQCIITTALKMKEIFITSVAVVFCCILIGIRIYLERSQQETQSHIGSDSDPLLEIVVDGGPTFSPVHSNIPHQKTYDVFVSFVYQGSPRDLYFIRNLHSALLRKEIKTFPNLEIIKREDNQKPPTFLSSIEASKISLIIFSEDYAFSQRCLDELEKIMECRSKYGQIVVPIYVKIDKSKVEHQNDTYWDAFDQHEQEFDSHKVQSWRGAMSKAAQVVGWTRNWWSIDDVYKVVDDITEDVLQKLNPTPQAAYTDVYISHADDDTASFATLLYYSLSEKQIIVSMDEVEQVSKGDTLIECRARALETSKISLIIFSKGYAQSRRCLDELVKVMDCGRRKGQIVMPILLFCSLSQLHDQDFELPSKSKKRLEMWNGALREAANLPAKFGLTEPECFLLKHGDLVEIVAEEVFLKLNPNHTESDSISGDVF